MGLNSNGTYTVEKNDTLSEIAQRYPDKIAGSTINDRVNTLVKLNNIKNRDLIYVGQVLKFSGTATTAKKNSTSSTARIDAFGLQANTERTLFATWDWDKSNTDCYSIRWYYGTGQGVSFEGNYTTTTSKQSVYTAPENATSVGFLVKPISKKHKVNGKEVYYWTASWSTTKHYYFYKYPSVPPVPTVEIEDYTLIATLDNLDVNANYIQFQIVKNNSSKVFKWGTSAISSTHASFSCKVDGGAEYKVRCRALKKSGSEERASAWSEYSSNIKTPPSTPFKITSCKASSKTSIYLEWSKSSTATSYDIEYTTKKQYFDGSDKTTTVSGVEFNHYEFTGLSIGEQYFFRVRAVNDKGHSGWSSIASIIIGKDPAAPTTWSSTTTAITGEPLVLYWVHNSEDGSSQTYAELELTINGVVETHTIKNTEDEDEKDKTSSYSINTSDYVEGSKILWRVRTAGITKAYGDWSVQRTVDIYAPPTLELNVTDINGNVLEILESFPFYISGLAGPKTQVPIGYHLVISANEMYETVDNMGNEKIVNAGEKVYSKYFDTSDDLLVEMSAYNVNLDNNISYTITCTAAMNSGLTVDSSCQFTVAWTDEVYEPNAEIGIDSDTITASIRPYCIDEDENLIDGILLSVYRREFDGSFTELATNIDNLNNTFITDPHPALDYARYRIVAISKDTGAVSYYDMPGYPVGEKAAIIQWDEDWSYFDSTDEVITKPPWSGSLLKLPYNIDVSDNNKSDITLVEYVGRKHPVSYYGTQLGSSSIWNMEIEKDDVDTLYALRRLMAWMGNVYVREPSGTGYWATISVSISQKHCDVTIPVSISVTRVEGGA